MQNHDPNEDTGGHGFPPAPTPKKDRSALIAVVIVAIIIAIILL